jgi:hypothetical protein
MEKVKKLKMEKLDEMVQKLNELLESESIDNTEFDFLINRIKDELKMSVKFLDFEYFNEDRLESARANKMSKVKLQDFETAAEFREMEKECLNYIQLKRECNIEKSTFYYDKNYLFYFCLGTSKYDKIVREYLNE